MDIVRIECPRCGATFEVNADYGTFYCKYCGCNLIPETFDGNPPMTGEVNRKPLEGSFTWLRVKLTKALRLSFGYLAFFVLIAIISTCSSCVGDAMETRSLENVERQILNDIEEENYEHALLTTKELEPSGSASLKKKEYWSQKQSEYEGKIIEMKRERDSSDPNYIPAPESSENLLGRNYEVVARRFTDAGFTYIKLIEEFYKPRTRKIPTARPGHTRTEVEPTSMYGQWTRESVSEIEFGCLTNFTTEDYCRVGEEIVIHYHGDGREPRSVQIAAPSESVSVSVSND